MTLTRLRNLLVLAATLATLDLTSVKANPVGATVVGGSSTVQGQGTPSVIVKQQTDKAIINWQTFNIGVGETTQFFQPSASSVLLNRVTGGLGPSQLYGTLTANGRIFIVNPDGILFGAGAIVDTAGFLATTHDIQNSDFMAGNYRFTIPGRPDASIVNLGTITARDGGFAALVAPGVRNSGTIIANLGTVGLASANGFTLDFYGDKLITLTVGDTIAGAVKDVETGQTLDALVKNTGTIKANAGRVELTAAAARQIVDAVINNTGVIEANTVGERSGTIILEAQTAATKPAGLPTQKIKVSGTLSAAGKNTGEKGGKVQITGESIEVSAARIDASGDTGGGKVLIGGDWSGGNPTAGLVFNPSAVLEPYSIPMASFVSVDPATTIDVSAKTQGNGGKAIVWSDGSTLFSGTIWARGGALSGDGGFVETSGRQNLTFNGVVDTGAPKGKNGTLLLDPRDTTIADSGTWFIAPSAIEAALLSGNVIVTTGVTGIDSGDITVAQNVTWGSGNSFTLSAYRNIIVNSGVVIANTGAGSLSLRADESGIGIGTVSFLGTGKVDFSGSTGLVSIFYNPPGVIKYQNPTNYSPVVLTNGAVPNQLTAYMLVNTVDDLQNIQQNLAGAYALGRDIDASATAAWNAGSGFIPLGNNITPFIGTFDGLEHTIDQLTINNPVMPIGPSFQPATGLFSWLGVAGQIKNVGLTNALVSDPLAIVGALVGVNVGTIINAYVTGAVTGSTTSTGGTVGGLIGENRGTVSRSYSTASVTGTGDVGGLVGRNQRLLSFTGSIWQSYATGSVLCFNICAVGGLIGANYGVIGQSYALGPVNVKTTFIDGMDPVINIGGIDVQFVDLSQRSMSVGGLVGFNAGGTITESFATGALQFNNLIPANIASYYPSSLPDLLSLFAASGIGGLIGIVQGSPTITNSYWDIETTGQATSPAGIGLTTTQLKSGLPAGFNATVWGSNPAINSGYPYLLWQFPGTSPSPTVLEGAGPPPPPPPPPPPQSTVLPFGFSLFGNGQTSFFTPVNMQIAESTTPYPTSNTPQPNFETITGQHVYVGSSSAKQTLPDSLSAALNEFLGALGPTAAIDFGELAKAIWDLITNIKTISELQAIIDRLNQLGISVPADVQQRFTQSFTQLGIGATKYLFDALVDASVNYLNQHNHNYSLPVIKSLADSFFWAATASTGVGAPVALVGEIQDQLILIAREYIGLQKDSGSLVNLITSNGTTSLDYLRNVFRDPNSSKARRDNALKLELSIIDSNATIAMELSGSMWLPQKEAGNYIQLTDSLLQIAVAQVLGDPKTSQIAYLKQQAIELDKQAYLLSQSTIDQTKYQNFMDILAQQYNISGW